MRHLFPILMAALVLSGCSTMSSMGEAVSDTVSGVMGRERDKTPPLPEIQRNIDIETVWSRQVGNGRGGEFVKLVPALDGDRLYAVDRSGRLYAFSAAAGSELWSVDLGVDVSAGPGVGDGLVVVGSANGEVIALHAAGGATAWRVMLNREILSLPRVGQGAVVIQGSDGSLHALDSTDGAKRWSNSRQMPVLTLRGSSSPVMVGGGVIAGFANGKLAAVTLGKGGTAWEATLALPSGASELERMVDVDAEPLVWGPVIVAGAYQNRIAAVAMENGQMLWTKDISTRSGFAADMRQLYVTDDDGVVWALSPRNGGSLWKQDRLEGRMLSGPAVLDGRVAVGDEEGWLHWLDGESGELVGRISLDSAGISAAPVSDGARLYVLGDGGRLTALQVR